MPHRGAGAACRQKQRWMPRCGERSARGWRGVVSVPARGVMRVPASAVMSVPASRGPAEAIGVPWYLDSVYWWAYVDPRAITLFERQWLVNLILWGNFD